MKARSGCTFAILITLAACSGKHRPFADGPIEGLGGSSGGVTTTIDPGSAGMSPGLGREGAATDGEPVGGVPVTLSPQDDAVQNSGSLACETDASTCALADAGPVPAACIPSGPRDCTSDADNDCDGHPDNTLDAVCECVSGTSEPCNQHPGLDGQGQCRAGVRTCLLDEVTLTTGWGECAGAVGPGDQDSCDPGDDTDCDGTPNEGCTCVDGQTQPCGSNTNTGPCQIGTSTCVDGRFGECIGAVAPASSDSCASRNDDSNCNGIPFDGCTCVNGETQSCGMTDTGACQLGTRTCVNGGFGECVGQVTPRSRDCRSQQDNNCDGRPDSTIDTVCQCSIGSTQACETHPGQDGVGRCRAGSRQCLAGQNNSSSSFGTCSGSVGPAARDCRSLQDNNCDGRPDNTIDNVCECVPGGGNAPCSDDPNNSRCNDQGRCAPCQADSDCSFISGGRESCSRTAGQCVARFACGDASPPNLTVLPEYALFSSAAPSTGGTILDGEYFQTVTYGTNVPTTFPGFAVGESFAIRGQFVHWRAVEFDREDDPGLPILEFIGTYSTSGNTITTEWVECPGIFTPGGTAGSRTMQYAASPTAIELLGTSTNGRFVRR